MVDLLFVQKDQQGKITNTMHTTDLSEAEFHDDLDFINGIGVG